MNFQDYQVFVIEQSKEERFNRGILMNIGFVEALKIGKFDCFIFHDVDLLTEDDRYMLPYLAQDISSLNKVLIFRYRKHKIKRI